MKRALRAAYLAAGFAFVGLAALGALLPVLPSTPLVLLAAACFARSSERFYNWVMNHCLVYPDRARITAAVRVSTPSFS